MKTALITGITGQDGSYLSEMLSSFGYNVVGLVRPNNSTDRFETLEKIKKHGVRLYTGDICDTSFLQELIEVVKPDEVYHLAAQSHVGFSFDFPEYTYTVNAIGTAALLMAIHRSGNQSIKFYNAATSELFGNLPEPQGIQDGLIFDPRSPYASSKMAAFWETRRARERGLFSVNGILFNHESPRRNPTFVTRKIVRQLAEILSGERNFISLGNMQAKRDWGFAPEYVYAMWLMLQQSEPLDQVIGTGETHSVADFMAYACKYAGVPEYKKLLQTDITQIRPAEVNCLRANTELASDSIGWSASVKFHDLVRIMIDSEFRTFGLASPGDGFLALKKLSKQDGFSWLVRDA